MPHQQDTCLGIPLPQCVTSLVQSPPIIEGRTEDNKAVELLRDFGRKLGRPEAEIHQACNLAAGPSDVLIILERPAPKHKYDQPFGDFVKSTETLVAVDDLIRFGTDGARSIHTVSVLDAYSFKPVAKANEPSDADCLHLLKDMLRARSPKVVIACWTRVKDSKLSELLGKFESPGVGYTDVRVAVDVGPSHIQVIPSFHPSKAVNYMPYNVNLRVLLIYHFLMAFFLVNEGTISQPDWRAGFATQSKSDAKSAAKSDA